MNEYKFTINGHDYTVTVGAIQGNSASVNVNGTDYQVTLPGTAPTAAAVAATPAVSATPAPTAAATPAGGSGSVIAPLPGVVLSIAVKPGDVVKASDSVVVLEAMKMENAIPAGRDGKVLAVNVKEGDSVLEGTTLVTLG